MSKPMTTALLILASGFTLSTTALAEPFNRGNRGSGYVNTISNAYSSATTPRVQSIPPAGTIATTSGFNDRDQVTNENVTAASKTGIETPVSRMFSIIASGFNNRS